MNTSQPDLRLVEQEPEAPDPNIGQTLDGRYLIESTLGEGGMGLVYAARHVILQKPLAVKVLKREVSRDEKVMARFRREAQAASAIGSQHICDVSDFGTLPDGSTYLVMEFLDGPSLASVIEDDEVMEIPRILDVVIQLCDALGAAHERGIVHRDLKPDNVHLVTRGDRKDFVKVLDFGIAKVGGAADKKLTQAGQVFGTPHYMSPEQCGGREVDNRTDIYALGVMLYEMTCGVVPFDADNLMGVLTKHVYENPIPPREFPPPVHVSPGLEAVILKSLAKQASDRYQSMEEFRADLVAVSEDRTPVAVMQAVGSASLPGTQMMGSEMSGLMGAYPAVPAAGSTDLDEPESKSRVLLMVGAAFAVLLLGAAAFGAAFFLPGGDEVGDGDALAQTTTPPVDQDQTPITPPVDTPPTETPEVPVEVETDAPVAEAVMITVISEPAGAEVYGADSSLLGNTPFEIAQPAEGAEPVSLTLKLAGYRDRTIPISHLSGASLTISLDRRRGGGRRNTQAQQTRPIQVRSLGTGGTPPVRRPPPTRSGGSGEIINPW